MSLFGTEVKILSTKKGTFLCLLGIDKMKLKIPKLYYLSELCKQKQKFYKNLFIYLFHAYLLHEWDRAIKQLVLPKLKRKWFFPRKVEEKSQQKYGTFFLNIGNFFWAFGYLIKFVFFCVVTLEIPTIGVVSIIYTEYWPFTVPTYTLKQRGGGNCPPLTLDSLVSPPVKISPRPQKLHK